MYIEVAVMLTAPHANNTYTYSVPEQLSGTSLLGKRVLVEFNNRKLEAYVLNEREKIKPGLAVRPVLEILDTEAVIAADLLKLAHWMADYYVSSPAKILNLMLPPLLKKPKKNKLKSVLQPDEWEQLDNRISKDEKIRFFFHRLWEKGDLDKKEALTLVPAEQLRELEKRQLIYYQESYAVKPRFNQEKGYVISNVFNWEKDYPLLKKKAPQQAAIINLLADRSLTQKELKNKKFNVSSINSLLKKGFIGWEESSSPIVRPDYLLNDEQNQAVAVLQNMLRQNKFSECLLWGVTGSGKTEVYVQAVEECLRSGKNAIVLVPEIALARQMINIFSARFEKLALLHSALTPGERYRQWEKIKKGEANVVLGARSALFAPLSSIGLIIIDEEQETSYKQEEAPRYHAREVARQRALIDSAVVLLGSATPSMETFQAALSGKIKMLTLKKRTAGARIPVVYIDNMKKYNNGSSIGMLLAEKIAQRLNAGEQSILFINRRGYSPRILCKNCGSIIQCPQCSVAMVYHLDVKQNICHYCNYTSALPEKCLACGQKSLRVIGAGTQKIEEEIMTMFPSARVFRLDMDKNLKGYQQEVLHKMHNQEIDILIGTQMVAKGFDFSEVSLVGIIDADSLLSLPDFRAGERGFQLMVQAAGRAGRAGKPGEVVIQTYNPDNPIVNLAAEQNYLQFALEEIKQRQLLHYPPFVEILRIVLSSEDENKVRPAALGLAGYIHELIDASEEDIQVLGSAPCPINKIKNRFRYHIMIKSNNRSLLTSLARYIKMNQNQKDIRLEIDFNPLMSM